MLRQVSTTSYPIPFFMADSLNPAEGKTGLSPTVTISKNGAAFGAPSGAISELSSGWYLLAGNATDRNTVGSFIVHAVATGADDTDVYCEITTHDPFNISGGGATAQQVWEYTTRVLTAGTNIGFPTAQNIWEYATRILTAGTNIGFPTAQNIWEYATRILTAGTNISIPSTSDIATAVWAAGTRTLSGFGTLVADVWAYATRILTASTNISIPTVEQIADQVWNEPSGDHVAAGSVGELIQDIDDEVDLIHEVAQSMAITGSALVKEASACQVTTGTVISGTYTDTNLDNAVYHTIRAAASTIDLYYEFNVGAFGVPVKVNLSAYLKETNPPGGDSISMFAYDWTNSVFELIQNDVLVGITGTTDTKLTLGLLARHVGTAAPNVGKVQIRLFSQSLEANTDLCVDMITIDYAETIAASIALILGDTAELQTDWTSGGRLDLILNFISKLNQADVKLDMATTPWTEKYYEKGTATLLLTKELYDEDGVGIDSIETYIGRRLEPGT